MLTDCRKLPDETGYRIIDRRRCRCGTWRHCRSDHRSQRQEHGHRCSHRRCHRRRSRRTHRPSHGQSGTRGSPGAAECPRRQGDRCQRTAVREGHLRFRNSLPAERFQPERICQERPYQVRRTDETQLQLRRCYPGLHRCFRQR